MPTAFDSQLAAASPMLSQQFGEAVTIQRGPNSTADVIVSWTSQGDEIVSPDGQRTTLVDRIWLVAKSLYLIADTATEPKTADRWTDAAGVQWEVLPSLAGPAVLSYEDGSSWEVKTKRIVNP